MPGFSGNARLVKAALANAARCGLLSLLMFLIFLLAYIADRKIVASAIVFYDGLICLAAVTFMYAALWLLACRKPARSEKYRALLMAGPQALMVFVLLGYAFVITVPSVLDRSISLYILGSVVAASDGGITGQDIDSRFYAGFVEGNKAVDKRLHEQTVTGNIYSSGGRYYATPQGRLTFEIYKSAVGLFNTDPRYVVPTDQARQ